MRLLALLILVGTVALCLRASSYSLAFLAAASARGARPPADLRRAQRCRGDDTSCTRLNAKTEDVITEAEIQAAMDKEFEEGLYPPEMMWNTKEPGVMKDYYPGARDFWSIFWGIIIPPVSAGFLVVGLSAFVGYDLVDLTPFTAKWLGFLRLNPYINWIPQGAFMTFYGAGGLFFVGPSFLYFAITNAGSGVARFDKRTEVMQIIRDGELLQEERFDDMDKVVLCWSELLLGEREIYIVKNDGTEIRFMETYNDPPKRVLERKAAELADFIGKDLDVNEQGSF